MLQCTCPAAGAIADIPKVTCPEDFGQIQKIAFTRIKGADGSKNKFTSAAAIALLASWSAKTAAEDGTKIVVSPYVNAPTSEPGAARTTGGGNDSRDGIEEVLGAEPTAFSCVMRSIPQKVAEAMKSLMCESRVGNLGVYLFDGNGRIEAIEDPDTAGTYYPIPVRAFFVSDKGHGGFDNFDFNNVSWSFEPNFSDNLKIVTPDFNPLTDL